MKLLTTKKEKEATKFEVSRQCYGINEDFNKYDRLTQLDISTIIDGKKVVFELTRLEVQDLLSKLNKSLNK